MEPRDGPCPPKEVERLDRDREFWTTLGWSLVLAGVALVMLVPFWFILSPVPAEYVWRGILVAGVGLYCGTLAIWARSKGRSALWGLMGLALLPGLPVIAFLPRRCRWCGRTVSRRFLHCPECGAPV